MSVNNEHEDARKCEMSMKCVILKKQNTALYVQRSNKNELISKNFKKAKNKNRKNQILTNDM